MEPDRQADSGAAAGGAGFRLQAWTRSRLLKTAVSAALLALLLTRVDLGALADSLRNVDPGWLALGTLAFLVANLVSVYKWRLILQAQDVPAPYFYLTTLFYIGLFFNNFLPTNFGGDVVKIFKLSRSTGRSVEAAGSVAMDRATSTLALLVIAAAPALFQLRLLGPRMVALILAMLGVALLLIILVVNEKAARRLGGLPLLRLDPMGMRRYLVGFYYELHRLQKQRSVMAAVMAVSVIYQCISVSIAYLLGRSLGIDISILYYFLFIPVVLAVSMIPLSLNGLGMREGAWVLLFSQIGVASAAAFSMSILSFLVITVVSLAGGVFYLFDRATPATQSEASRGQ